MLPLVLALGACDNEKYWCESKTNCVTAREFADDGLVAYKIFMTCGSPSIFLRKPGDKECIYPRMAKIEEKLYLTQETVCQRVEISETSKF